MVAGGWLPSREGFAPSEYTKLRLAHPSDALGLHAQTDLLARKRRAQRKKSLVIPHNPHKLQINHNVLRNCSRARALVARVGVHL